MEIVLIATAGDGGAASEVAGRLAAVAEGADGGRGELAAGGVRVLPFPLGPQAHAALAAIMESAPARVVAVPLATGVHDPLVGELGGLLRWGHAWWPGVPVIMAAPLATTHDVVEWAARRVETTLASLADAGSPAASGVLVVGPGGAPAMANAESCAIGRLLWEAGDLRLVETAFLEDGRRPSVAARIAHCRRLGVRRLVVLPLALLDGPLAAGVRAAAAGAARGAARDDAARDDATDGMEVVVAGALLGHAAAAAVAGARRDEAVSRWLATGDDGLPPEPAAAASPPSADSILPPRYRGGSAVSAAPMRSASLQYDADGRVAWNRVWQSFCNLALAGGPPHRGSLLEPALREEVLDDLEGQARVVAEIARGLSLITRLPVVTDRSPGWVGVVCPDEEMAIWMLRAITVENISVRREGATLFLPAGPRYRVEKEIKNVITAVAKTHHYWTEHRAGR